ncbi:MAG: hypothetical protein IJY52_01525 [Anaerotignum sp.]|nr:hypothetical protein [Anaerotignum sp.]
MTLKDILRDDLEDVFFDLDEFAETHTVNGKQMSIIIDGNELGERKAASGKHFDGAYSNTILMYVKAEEYGARPKVGSMIVLDDKHYKVADVVDEGGVYSIAMGAVRA